MVNDGIGQQGEDTLPVLGSDDARSCLRVIARVESTVSKLFKGISTGLTRFDLRNVHSLVLSG